MDVTASGTSVLAQRYNKAPLSTKPDGNVKGSFGQMLDNKGDAPDGGAAAAPRYDSFQAVGSSPKAFAAMPIVAPVSVDFGEAPAISDNFVEQSMRKPGMAPTMSQPITAESPNLVIELQSPEVQPIAATTPTLPAQVNIISAESTIPKIVRGFAPLISDGVPKATDGAIRNYQIVDAETYLAAKPPVSSRSLSNMAVRLWQSDAGLQILIRLSRLGDDESNEMKTRINDLARQYGFNVDDLRINSTGKG